MRLNKRVSELKPAATLVLNQKAKALQASGVSIVNLTAGEPDFSTPPNVCEKAFDAIRRGETRYTATSGIPELRRAVAQRATGTYGREFGAQEVVVTSGAKQALFNASLALLDEGDEAVIFAPYWVSYAEMVRLAGANAVIVKTDRSSGFMPTPEQIRNAVSQRTRLIFLNSPCNPTGAVFPRPVLEAVAQAALQHPDVTVVTDDIYEHFLYDDREFLSVGMLKDLPKEQLLIVNGVSKSYSMTGWRLGWAVADRKIIEAMDTIQSTATSNAASVSQWAALEALTGPQTEVASRRRVFQERRDRIHDRMTKIPGLHVVKPAGAFYFFPECAAFVGSKTEKGSTIRDDVELATYLLENHGVAVVPGSAFGAPNHLRISIGASLPQLEEGIDRMSKGLTSLRRA
ncbi:MAG: pyridoxal phosphate-dependent aminotransferase [Pseudomonadota bacterium]